MCGLTFELSGHRRRDAMPGLAKMYRVPTARAWWPAVGAPLERRVRPRWFEERWFHALQAVEAWSVGLGWFTRFELTKCHFEPRAIRAALDVFSSLSSLLFGLAHRCVDALHTGLSIRH
jgi:hypothetical protein